MMNSTSIPVIDIRNLGDSRTLQALDQACRYWGFFQVRNHGIDDRVIQHLFNAATAFFAQPGKTKRRISRTVENPWGFYDRELTKNVLDWKEIYDYGPAEGSRAHPQWPTSIPGFQDAIHSYYTDCEMLAFKLLAAIACNLDMPREYLASCFEPTHTSFLRLNYYPVCPKPARPEGMSTARDGHLGINHHTDAGALTILLQDDQPGLEVYRRGKWHLVEPRRDALVVNIGDIVQVWSNDRYKASLHRVAASIDAPRYSAPFFFNPRYQTNYQPLPSTVDAANPERYRTINWGEFRALRAAGDYADLGDEVQIDHYRNP